MTLNCTQHIFRRANIDIEALVKNNIVNFNLNVDKFAYLTPFKHFDTNQILKTGSFDITLVMISVVVIVLSFVGSYILYNRRDIHSV